MMLEYASPQSIHLIPRDSASFPGTMEACTAVLG